MHENDVSKNEKKIIGALILTALHYDVKCEIALE